MRKLASAATYVLCFAAAILLARYDLHTDDTGVEVFLLLAVTFLLGCMHPRHAWQWALLVGPGIPIAEALFKEHGSQGINFASLSLVAAFVIGLGLAGSYSGAFARRSFRT
jgi:hypothetical protein